MKIHREIKFTIFVVNVQMEKHEIVGVHYDPLNLIRQVKFYIDIKINNLFNYCRYSKSNKFWMNLEI